MSKKHILTFLFLIIFLVIVFIFSCISGAGEITFSKVIQYFFCNNLSSVESDIIGKLRLPRIILGILVGAGLSVSGSVLQAMLRNPLAEPYTIGISGASALGVSLGIILGVNAFLLPLFSSLSAAAAMFFVYFLAAKRRFSISAIILGGVILSFFFSSCVQLIFSLAKTEKVHGAILWLMGDLSGANYFLIKMVAPIILGGIGMFIIFGRDINILTLGEEKASYLGINAEAFNKILFIFCSLVIGSCVAVSGIISFVGLIIPHILRYLLGSTNYRLLIPACALAGAGFLTLCDTLARTVILPLEFPVGVITGIIGGVFFLGYFFFTPHHRKTRLSIPQ